MLNSYPVTSLTNFIDNTWSSLSVLYKFVGHFCTACYYCHGHRHVFSLTAFLQDAVWTHNILFNINSAFHLIFGESGSTNFVEHLGICGFFLVSRYSWNLENITPTSNLYKRTWYRYMILIMIMVPPACATMKFINIEHLFFSDIYFPRKLASGLRKTSYGVVEKI